MGQGPGRPLRAAHRRRAGGSQGVLREYQKILGIGSGCSGADPCVIALAHAHAGVVVTEETLSRNLTKPKIPDVCDAMGVRRLNLLQFVQEQGWVFR